MRGSRESGGADGASSERAATRLTPDQSRCVKSEAGAWHRSFAALTFVYFAHQSAGSTNKRLVTNMSVMANTSDELVQKNPPDEGVVTLVQFFALIPNIETVSGCAVD